MSESQKAAMKRYAETDAGKEARQRADVARRESRREYQRQQQAVYRARRKAKQAAQLSQAPQVVALAQHVHVPTEVKLRRVALDAADDALICASFPETLSRAAWLRRVIHAAVMAELLPAQRARAIVLLESGQLVGAVAEETGLTIEQIEAMQPTST